MPPASPKVQVWRPQAGQVRAASSRPGLTPASWPAPDVTEGAEPGTFLSGRGSLWAT